VALRVVEIILPEGEADTLGEVLAIDPHGGPWRMALEGGLVCQRFVLEAEASGGLVDEIQRRYANVAGFHLLILPVSASLPRPASQEDAKVPASVRKYGSKGGGLTREELHAEGFDMARPTGVFYATVVLSTIVVAIGLLRDNPAVIIGAMVIAPLLGPNVALALATTLADTKLMRLSSRSNALGFVIALGITILLGVLIQVDPTQAELASRTGVHWSDILLALAAGSAGALALTTGMPIALVGVMVAVALLPPTAVLGLMLGGGHMELAGGALLLLMTNLICVNLAATVTFRVHGIQPRTWWDAKKATRSSRLAVGIGVALLVLLGLLILYTQ